LRTEVSLANRSLEKLHW